MTDIMSLITDSKRQILLCFRNVALLIVFFCSFCFYAFGQNAIVDQANSKAEKYAVPLSSVFHNVGWNALNSITYNYGLNFIGAGIETWASIETGLDWKWRNMAYNNVWLSNSGISLVYIGYIVPGIAPLTAYITGRAVKNKKLQFLGLALAQSLLLNFGVQVALKMTTSRALPEIVTALDHKRSFRADDFSGKFDWFSFNFIGGWPSAHTSNAFSAAAIISEIYNDNFAVKICAYIYAAIMGFGVSVSVHWASDAFAGMLIGHAIGKTIGKSYRTLIENDAEKQHVSFYATGNSFGVIISL